MEVIAQAKNIRISPRKVRLVAKTIRNNKVDQALNALSLMHKRAASPIEKVLKSAIANAINNTKLERNGLVIDRIEVTQGLALKRFHPSTRGRVHPYKKRGSHIKIVLKEVANGTKS